MRTSFALSSLIAVSVSASSNHIGTLGVTGSAPSIFGKTHLWRHVDSSPKAVGVGQANKRGFWWDFTHPNAARTDTTAQAKCDCIPGYHDALDITCHIDAGGHIRVAPSAIMLRIGSSDEVLSPLGGDAPHALFTYAMTAFLAESPALSAKVRR